MAGSGTIPALATMPTEVVCMIGADLSIHKIKEWFLASKRFRDIFLSQICRQIKFSGNMEQLENSLLSYFQTETASFRDVVHNHIRCVIFDAQAFDTRRSMRAWARRSPIGLLQVGHFIISNPNLHQVTFNTYLERFKEVSLFMKLVEAGPQWTDVKNLSFQSPSDNAGVIGAVIQKLENGELQRISACPEIFYVTQSILHSHFSNVTSLSLRRQGRKDWRISRQRDPVIAGLDEDLLDTIHRSFPQLESLVLYDGILDDCTSSGPLTSGVMLARIIRRALLTLEKMQSLRHFAFDFDKSRLEPDAIPELLERTPSGFKDVLSQDLEDEEMADCILLSLLVSRVSTIEEICMTSQYPGFYRATLTDGEWDMSWDSFDDPSQKDLFPSVLMG
ncbi:hypothetical protein LZL87_005706 [Fusarium oxysporum]|nr:hypothetical protein LZL87_005706 [Fusarium oxysporum]